MLSTSNFEFLKQHDELLFKLAETARAALMSEERTIWEAIAEQQEQQLNQLKQQHEAANKSHAVEFTAQPAEVKAEVIKAIEKSPFNMNEAETRLLIDAQLRESEWIVDSENQTYGKGVRPEKGHNKAIAEWPTKTGPVDYLLFNGLIPVAAIKAKKAQKTYTVPLIRQSAMQVI